MQPVMEKRKSITKLTQAKDITEKTSKYCLMTQSQDSDGDLETRLYKVRRMSFKSSIFIHLYVCLELKSRSVFANKVFIGIPLCEAR